MYQYKGQGRFFDKCGTKFVQFGTKISKKNNLKQKSYEINLYENEFVVVKLFICATFRPAKRPLSSKISKQTNKHTNISNFKFETI